MTIHLPSSALLFLVDKFGRGESLIASAIMSTSICLMVGWEQRIFGKVYSLFSFVSCMFGHLTGFLFFLIRILVISWSYPFITTTTSNSIPLALSCMLTYSLNQGWPTQLHHWANIFVSILKRAAKLPITNSLYFTSIPSNFF